MFSQQATVSSDFGPVFRALPGMFAILTKELTILEVTDAYLQARYTTRETLNGSLLTDTFSGTSALLNTPPTQALEQSLQHVLFHKKTHHIPMLCFNLRVPATLGGGFKECYWNITNTPVLDDEGELLHILHEAQEITDKTKISGNQLNSDQFPLLANNVNAVSWEYDLVHNKMYWGSGLKEIFGYTPEEMGEGGESWDERVHSDDFETVQKSIERANASGSKIWTGEYRFRKADGTYIPVLDQGYIIYHSDGRPIRTLGSIIDLSENRKTEVSKEGDARFRHLLEVLPHMAWMAEPSGRVLYFNKNWYSYTGMSTNQTEGWTSYIHPDDTAIILTEWHNTLNSGEPYEVEYRLRNFHDKNYRWFLERGVPIYGTDGNIQYWIGTLTDIEEQKQVMERIREKDLQLENILNHSPVHFCLLHGPEHTCHFITPGVNILFGNRAYLNKTAATIWPELHQTNFLSILNEVYTTGKTIQVKEYKLTVDRFRKGEFTEIYINLEYRPILSNGQTAGILISAIEVTELVKAKQQMAHNQHSLQLLSKVTGSVTWEYDVKNQKLAWGEAYKDMFGYTAADLDTHPDTWKANVHPEDYSCIRASIDTAIAKQQKSWTGEYRYRKADGTYADVLDHGYIFYDATGDPEEMLGSIVDITRQKKHELELQYNSERFKRIAMATNDVLWDWDLETDSLWWSEGYTTLFGHKLQDSTIISNSWSRYIHPEDVTRITDSIREAINSTDNLWEAEYRYLCADNSYKLIKDKGHIIRDVKGKGIRMFGAMLDITEKNRIEQQLQASNARTLEILESLPLLTWTATPDGKVNYYNQRWYNYTGTTFQEMQEKGWEHLIHTDDLQETIKCWQDALETGNTLVAENRWLAAEDGKYRWFLARAVPIRNDAGEITMWVGSHTEIEEQKRIMLFLEEGNNKFRYLTESSPQIVWSANPDGNIDYTSKQWYDYTQMTIEESLGYGWAPAIHPDDLQTLMDAWAHSLATGDLYSVEVRLKNVKTGIYKWFLIKAQPIRNKNNEIIKWYGAGVNIDEMKVLQEQLQESEKQLRFLTESIPQMVWTANPDGVVDFFNTRWVNYTGLSLEESTGPTAWLKVLHPDDLKMASERWQHAVATGEFYEIEYRLLNGKQGFYRWFLGQAIPMRDAQGNIVKWFGTCTDIEDHKKAEEELVEKNLELESTNRDLDSFVYTASHDLKLPITNMAGIFQELIHDAEFKAPDAPELINMFNKSLEQIYNTINDLGEVVKVQKTKVREYEQVSLQELIAEIKVSIQDNLVATGTSITTDFNAVPALAFGKANLRSILYNLISNAIKYRQQNRKPEIHISATRKGDFVELKVQDNGLGIDLNKHHNKLFQMFRRFHNHVSGSGLGLYIVNRLLTNSGGYINIESTVNEGTTFFLYFKQKKA